MIKEKKQIKEWLYKLLINQIFSNDWLIAITPSAILYPSSLDFIIMLLPMTLS